MLTIPVTLTRVIVTFAPLFSKRVWEQVQVLVVGALLAPGQRTVTAVLRVMGLSQERHFQNYHRVLNRARWSSLATARVLLELVVQSFAPTGVVVIGLDDTLERRRGGADQGQRHLPRPGAVVACAGGESQWAAVALCDGVGRNSVGQAGVGFAVSHGSVSFRTLSSAARAASQAVATVGRPTHWPHSPLAARTRGGHGGR